MEENNPEKEPPQSDDSQEQRESPEEIAQEETVPLSTLAEQWGFEPTAEMAEAGDKLVDAYKESQRLARSYEDLAYVEIENISDPQERAARIILLDISLAGIREAGGSTGLAMSSLTNALVLANQMGFEDLVESIRRAAESRGYKETQDGDGNQILIKEKK